MSDDKFGAIVIGAGPAGSTAAYLLAKSGLDVLLIERGSVPGCKNMFGGRMYSYALERIFPKFYEEAPVERSIVKEIITFSAEHKDLSVTLRNQDWLDQGHSFTLLRASFDAWLAGKAEEAGAILTCGIQVDDLLLEDGKVVGIKAGEDELFADVVVAADGVNSLIAQKAGLRNDLKPREICLGIKQIIKLSPEIINQRFQLKEDEGAAGLFVGDCTKGLQGGGFFYTNKDCISLGLVVSGEKIEQGKVKLYELLEDFKTHSLISKLIEGGQVSEYSAHLIPEAGLEGMPKSVGDGIVVVGDAAGFVLNLGFMVRGMDLAILSGEAAAQAILKAKEKEDFSAQSLGVYQRFLEENTAYKQMSFYSQVPKFLGIERIYSSYPKLLTRFTAEMFTAQGKTNRIYRTFSHCLKGSGLNIRNLISDAWKGGKIF